MTNTRPVRIWSLGDSITQGSVGGSLTDPAGGYRKPLRDALFAAGYAFLMVGTLTGGELPAQLHDGHNGATIESLREEREAWQDAVQPDLVLLMAGTNNQVNVGQPERRAGAAFGLMRLVEEIIAGTGHPSVIVAEIPPADLTLRPYSPDTPELIARYNAAITATVTAAEGRGLPVSIVSPGLTTADLSDGVHPNASGYAKISTAFLAAAVTYFEGLD